MSVVVYSSDRLVPNLSFLGKRIQKTPYAQAAVDKDGIYMIGGNGVGGETGRPNGRNGSDFYCLSGKAFLAVMRHYTRAENKQAIMTLTRFADLIDRGQPWRCWWHEDVSTGVRVWKGRCQTGDVLRAS